MNTSATLVKICGLSTPEALETALGAGADMVGLVFFSRSPRHVSLDRARSLAEQARGRAEIVALTVDADDAALAAIVETVSPDWVQLHGGEIPARVSEVRARFGRPVMKAIGVARAGDLAAADAFAGVADSILFDAKPPTGALLPGGNGVTFDWRLLQTAPPSFVLSGGLSAENVAEAIRISRPAVVDVSSGVESAPGVKDPARIRAFIEAVKGANRT